MSSSILKMQHSSLQRNDPQNQQRHDVDVLFTTGGPFVIKTGTEAGVAADGSNHNRRLLLEAANDFNHIIHFAGDCWVAVDRKVIVPKTHSRGRVYVADKEDVHGKSYDRQFPTLGFEHVDSRVGYINVASVHYPTGGPRPGDPNYKINRRYARKLQEWMREVGVGTDLAFANGDFNMNDKKLDWSFGGTFTSMADELKKYPPTHGKRTIDGLNSYNKDGRVSAKRMAVLPDSRLHLFADHNVCRGWWEVRHLKGAA